MSTVVLTFAFAPAWIKSFQIHKTVPATSEPRKTRDRYLCKSGTGDKSEIDKQKWGRHIRPTFHFISSGNSNSRFGPLPRLKVENTWSSVKANRRTHVDVCRIQRGLVWTVNTESNGHNPRNDLQEINKYSRYHGTSYHPSAVEGSLLWWTRTQNTAPEMR